MEHLPREIFASALTLQEKERYLKESPDLLKKFLEIDQERIMYKKNEYSYRRHLEKLIVTDIQKAMPSDLKLDVACLYNAKSFISGDFIYAGKCDSNKLLLWIGDSISHGTGSAIVKSIINDTIKKAFSIFKTKTESRLEAFVQKIQTLFSSKNVVKSFMEADLSDIITGNDYYSKISIITPIVFLQINKRGDKTGFQICNRAMPLIVILKYNSENGPYTSGVILTKQSTFMYSGQHKESIETIDSTGIPLMLDRKLFNSYAKKILHDKGLELSDENTKELFESYEYLASPKDLIVVASDGVTEMVNENNEQYGINRFIDQLILFFSKQPFDAKLSYLKEAYYFMELRNFTHWDENRPVTGNGIQDDMTMLLMRVEE